MNISFSGDRSVLRQCYIVSLTEVCLISLCNITQPARYSRLFKKKQLFLCRESLPPIFYYFKIVYLRIFEKTKRQGRVQNLSGISIVFFREALASWYLEFYTS